MKKIISLIWVVTIVMSSCQKTSTQTNTNPPPPTPVDTNKPNSPDTSYLTKTDKYYNYDMTGTQITDSGLFVWTFDNKRRITSRIGTDFEKGTRDTITYTYNLSQRIVRTVIYYSNPQIISDYTATYYLNATGQPDSVIANYYFVLFNNGVPNPQSSVSGAYYYYDAEGRDTLALGYNIYGATKTPYTISRFIYKGNDLDSLIQYNNPADLNTISYIAIYQNGNLVSDEINPYGTPHSSRIYTYYNTSAGGFYVYDGPALLKKSILQTFINPAGSNSLEEYTYAFDAANRAKALTITQNSIIKQKSEFTYY